MLRPQKHPVSLPRKVSGIHSNGVHNNVNSRFVPISLTNRSPPTKYEGTHSSAGYSSAFAGKQLKYRLGSGPCWPSKRQLRSWYFWRAVQVALAASASSNQTLSTLLKGKLMKGVLVKGAKHAMQSTVGAGAGLVSDSRTCPATAKAISTATSLSYHRHSISQVLIMPTDQPARRAWCALRVTGWKCPCHGLSSAG
jgi:hypothetical protein